MNLETGIIKNSKDLPFLQKNGDCDFSVRIAINPSVRKFLAECYAEYGKVEDREAKNLKLDNLIMVNIYTYLAAFEGLVRMRVNNLNLIKNKGHFIKFSEILNELMDFYKMSIDERNKLENSRKFLNKIKHKKESITVDEIVNFISSYRILINYDIVKG